MRRYVIIAAFAFFAVGIIVVVLVSRSKPARPSAVVIEQQPPSAREIRPVPSESTQLEMSKQAAKREVDEMIAQSSDPEYARYYLEQRMSDPSFDWKQPINFYGKVIDEKGRPVEDALVDFRWNDLSEQGTSRANVVSDATGVFTLEGKQGKILTVSVSKEGYHSPAKGWVKGFEYANPFEPHFHRPDSQNPVIFHLHKKGEGEPMIHGLKLFGSRIDGTPSYVDLVKGKNQLTPPGDLMLRVTRGERNANGKFDWAIALEIPDGGLVESTNGFMFVAPEAGYQPRFEFARTASDRNWVSQLKRRFYVKSRNGQMYSRIEITFIPSYNDIAAADIKYFVNPSGSRNLEFDPEKEIKVNQDGSLRPRTGFYE